jgi:hypothetical protein
MTTEQNLTDWIDGKLEGVSDAEADDPEAVEFYSSMTPEQRERAEGDEEYRDQLWAEWNADADEDSEDSADAGDDDEVDEDVAAEVDFADDDFVPRNAQDLIRWANARDASLEADGWEGGAQGFVAYVASDAKYWLDLARDYGWPADARPLARDLPDDMQLRVAAQSLNVAWGGDGARVIPDPLRRLRPPRPSW